MGTVTITGGAGCVTPALDRGGETLPRAGRGMPLASGSFSPFSGIGRQLPWGVAGGRRSAFSCSMWSHRARRSSCDLTSPRAWASLTAGLARKGSRTPAMRLLPFWRASRACLKKFSPMAPPMPWNILAIVTSARGCDCGCKTAPIFSPRAATCSLRAARSSTGVDTSDPPLHLGQPAALGQLLAGLRPVGVDLPVEVFDLGGILGQGVGPAAIDPFQGLGHRRAQPHIGGPLAADAR